MKEYEYTIIRRESRNPKRNREGRGISQSDLEALRQELAGDQRDADSTVSDLINSLGEIDNLSSSIEGITADSSAIKERLEGAEQAISGKLDSGTFDKWRAEDYKRATDRLTTAETAISKKLDSGVFDQWKAGDYSQRQSALDEAIKSKQPAGKYALSSELESHKRATDKSFEELNNHPLTVDSNGYWRIWSVKDGAYKTTEYQSRGRDGEPGAKGADGKDAGRYLGRATHLNTSISRNYRAEESRSWETANEGDYVYLTISEDDWEKGNYYIVRERKDKTVWELYDIKGRDGEDGAKGDQGDKGADGHTPVIRWDGTKLLIDDLQAVDLRGHDGRDGTDGRNGTDGKDGHTPSPDEVLATDLFKQKLSGEVTMQVTPVANKADASLDQLKDARSQITRVASGLSVASTNISKLQKWSTQTDSSIKDLTSKTSSASGDITSIKDTLAKSNQYIDTAFEYLQNISNQITSSRSYNISTTGYVTSYSGTCAFVEKDISPGLGSCIPPKEEPQIRITLRSDFDQLKRQVDSLTAQLAQLQSANTITPITDTRLRIYGSTLYPKYGDWLLTSDSQEQYLSFSGLNAEVGKSIYIQTRKKVYLYATGFSFFGLPGTSSSTAVNQWLSNNTTYRFVRANATAWLVTASSSPYPWT